MHQSANGNTERKIPNANVIVMPDIYEKYRQVVLEPRFIRVSGTVQNQDGIVQSASRAG